MSSSSIVVPRGPTDYTKQRIARIAEGALQSADVVDVYPTPMAAVQRSVGVRERLSTSDLPKAVAIKKPSRIKQLLGAYVHKERTVFIDTSQPEPRVNFTDAHETIHAACEWHDEAMRWDGDDELFKRRYEEIEGEANYGAGHLLFQGGRFHNGLRHEGISLAIPIAVRGRYGTSVQATAHYYVEEHTEPVALLILGRYIDVGANTFPVWRAVHSASFFEQFGDLAERYADGVPADTDSLTGGLLADARTAVHPPASDALLPDLEQHKRKCTIEAFFNGHVQMLMISPRHRTARGRRLQLASA